MDQLVECHSGYEYSQRPQAIKWEGQRREVAQVLTDWRIPGGKCFRVRTFDEQVFELFYDELCDEWRISQP